MSRSAISKLSIAVAALTLAYSPSFCGALWLGWRGFVLAAVATMAGVGAGVFVRSEGL